MRGGGRGGPMAGRVTAASVLRQQVFHFGSEVPVSLDMISGGSVVGGDMGLSVGGGGGSVVGGGSVAGTGAGYARNMSNPGVGNGVGMPGGKNGYSAAGASGGGPRAANYKMGAASNGVDHTNEEMLRQLFPGWF